MVTSRDLFIRSSGAVALAATLVLGGCGLGKRVGQEPAPIGPGVVAPPPGIKFTVRVTPVRFARGDKVSLEADLFNDSEKSFKRKCPTSCVWDFEVTAEDGHHAGPPRECTPDPGDLKLEPGELRVILRKWGGTQGYFGTAVLPAPGKYRVSAGFVDATGAVIPMSDPVEIEILPK